MKLTVLIENKFGKRKDLAKEHGISIYIEYKSKNILFDTGQSGDFIDNAEKMDIDLEKLDYVVLSHGHYDHSGGFKRLVEEVNPDIELFIASGFFDRKYNQLESGDYRYVGNPYDEEFLKKNNIKVNYVDEDIFEIGDGIFIFSDFIVDEEFKNKNQNMYIKNNGNYLKDEFTDEIALGIETDKGLVVLVGCSHIGVVNILDTIIKRSSNNVHALIGGTHLILENDEKINRIIDYFKEKEIRIIGACHCTGKQGRTMLGQQMENVFTPSNTGNVFEI